MNMSDAVPCFHCEHEAVQSPYGVSAVHIGCSNKGCPKPNSVVEDCLEDAVKSWNREQKRLTNMRRKKNG
jgi:hypothetical protein